MGNKKVFILLLFITHFSVLMLCNADQCIENEAYTNYNGGPKITSNNGLRDNFYNESCPYAESIVRNITQNHVRKNPKLPAQLLRLHFHDCFVRGCDGSILLNSTVNSTAEKDEKINLSLAGYDVIEEIKAQLETDCEGIVSCADILALAARDAVSLQYNRALWRVPTGRRDGTISKASEVIENLPSPFLNFTQQEKSFARKGLSIHDLVTLSGAHTIGSGHCTNVGFRLFNFTSDPSLEDPSMNKTYGNFLKKICNDPLDIETTVPMDPGSIYSFDNHYYVNLIQNKGLFYSDAQLLTNPKAYESIQELLHPKIFFDEFAISMQKMGVIDAKTGSDGEIRRKCSFIN